jgi:hypothetical protein
MTSSLNEEAQVPAEADGEEFEEFDLPDDDSDPAPADDANINDCGGGDVQYGV